MIKRFQIWKMLTNGAYLNGLMDKFRDFKIGIYLVILLLGDKVY